MPVAKRYNISQLSSRVTHKELTLTNNSTFSLPASSAVDKNCTIIKQNTGLSVECHNGNVQLLPTYHKRDKITLGGLILELIVKEITDGEDMQSYKALAKFHYKDRDIFGRTAILVATTSTPYLPKVIGYIELATPFYVNKPRAEILNSRFRHNGIKWNAWDVDTTKKYINTIVRIARCVVYPEFRGVGLGNILVEHAEAFAKSHWQISKLKPLFLEISADMLKYVPFAEKAGMHYIGETQGNLNRIHKDLTYLLTNHKRVQSKEIVSDHQMGIVEQQKSRLRKAMKLAKDSGITIKQLIDKLENLQKQKRLSDFTFFNGLVSLPKPTYIKGLDEKAEKFIVSRLPKNKRKNFNFYDMVRSEPISSPITLINLSLGYSSSIRRTKKTQAINNAFGISPTDIDSAIINDLNFTIQPGEIVLVVGSSGSGKTTLLNFLNKKLKGRNVKIKGKSIFPDNYRPGEFLDIKSKKPLIEYFGGEDVNYALQLMGNVGLSDAYVFLKRYSELSKGQQYRVLMAKLIHSKSNVFIADEFCSNLDPITSNVLAHKMHSLTKKLGKTLIVGAAHCENFIGSLKPDKVLRLSTAWDYEVIEGSKFLEGFSKKVHKLRNPTLKLKKEFFDLILHGKKQSTIRLYNSSFSIGPITLISGSRVLQVYVKKIEKRSFSKLTKADAQRDGFNSLIDLKRTLNRFYQKLVPSSQLAILTFETVDFKK